MGPRKNLVGLLKDATLRHGLRWGVTVHFARNYNFFQTGYGSDRDGPKKGVPYIADTPENRAFYHPPHGDTNPKYPRNPSEAWKESWSRRVSDLIDRYDLDFLYFDGALPFDEDDGLTGRRVLARYYNRGRERHGGEDQVVMTIKTARGGHGIYREGVATLDLERSRLGALRVEPWQTDDTIGEHRWSYEVGMRYRSVDFLVDELVDIVSKNGNLLLSVPPKADGTFDADTVRILRELGKWNRQNGEAIFGTRPWIRFGEGDVRFTRSGDQQTMYAILLKWPEDGRCVLRSLSVSRDAGFKTVRAVSLVGSSKAVVFRHDGKGLHLTLPERTNDYAVAVRIDVDGVPRAAE
jgi:alpha-L-fucosidase